MQSALLPVASVNDRLRVLAFPGAAPLWTTVGEAGLLFQLHGLPHPDGSLDLVGAPATGISDVELTESWDTLLPLAIEEASFRQATALRTLVWDESPAVSVAVLEKHGFRSSTRLHCWTKKGVPPFRTPDRVDVQPLTEVVESSRDLFLAETIAATLESSWDLLAMPKPSPDGLLQQWLKLDNPRLLTCRQNDAVTGFAVTTADTTSAAATLEYVGVAKNNRRQGVGRLLLMAAMSRAADYYRLGSRWTMNAYCDEKNAPAIGFYRSTGFIRGIGVSIWVFKA